MASSPHQNIKNEKLNAMRNFQRNRMLEIIYHLLNLCATLFLFWNSSLFPIALRSFWKAYSLLIPLFNNSFCVFLFLNAVIFVVYALSDKNHGGSNETDDHCFQITVPETVNVPAESSPEKETDSSNGELSPNFEETVTAVTESTTTMTTTCCTTVSTRNGREKVSEEKSFRRVQSESYERRVVAARKLKRSSTGLKKEPQRRLCYVEELSKDEFNRTVEDFIAKHKRMQLEEQLRSHKTEYLAIK